jgi:hypothetical protein
MADDPEYEDIQTPEDHAQFVKLLQEALYVAELIANNKTMPLSIQKAAVNIIIEAKETFAFMYRREWSEIKKIPPEVKEEPGVRHKRRRKGELSKGVIEFTKVVKKDPKYSNAEFKCIGDLDKCKKDRGEKSTLCWLAFFICMGKRIIPFVRHT